MKIVNWLTLTEDGPTHDGVSTATDKANSLLYGGCEGHPFEGFGCCFNELGWIALQNLPDDAKNKILDDLFTPEHGFVFNRIPVGANDYSARWYSHNEHGGDYAMEHFNIAKDEKYLLPYVRAAFKRNPRMRLFASPWSPPAWMKNPPVYNYGKLVKTKKNLEAYALYLMKFLKAYSDLGLPIERLFVQNEVCADQKFPSCLWSGEEYRDFVRDYLGPLFALNDIKTEIWLGTLNCEHYEDYLPVVMLDEKTAGYIGGVGYQWAGKHAVQRAHMSFPDLKIMQTENECGMGTNSFHHAQYVFGLIQHYLTNGASAYTYWNAVLASGGRSTWGWTQNSLLSVNPENGAVTYNPEYFLMRQIAAYVRPGARRVVTQGAFTGLGFVFDNTDGTRVLCLHNPYAEPVHFVTEGRELVLKGKSIHTVVLA